MANKISFTFIANNKFTKIGRVIARSVGKITKKFRGMSRQVDKSSKKFNKSTRSMSSGFKALAVSALAFFSIQGFFSIATEFQDSMADLSAITGAAGKDLDTLTDKIFELSKTASISGSKVATAFKLVASAKPDLLQNLDALAATTEQVLLLKNASGIDLASAANITAQALNIFGKDASFASKFVNVLAAGAKLGSSEIADTGEAMLIAGPAARAAGLDFLQLNSALQTVAIGGIKGSRAGTALNTILGRLRRQSFDFEKEGLAGVFERIGKQLNAVTDSTARAKLEAKLFGEEHSKVGLALVGNFKHLDKFEKVLKGTNIAQEQADIRLGTFSAKMRRLGAILSEKLIIVFQKLEPMLAKMADRFATFFDSMDSGDLNGLTAQLKILLSFLDLVLDAGVAIASVFKGVGTVIGEFAGRISALDFSDKITTSIGDAFSINGKLFGLFGGDEKDAAASLAPPSAGVPQAPSVVSKSQSEVNVNLRAQPGAIESVTQKTTGNVPGFNLGVNMAAQL